MASVQELSGAGLADVEGIESRCIFRFKRATRFLSCEENPAKRAARPGHHPPSMMNVYLAGDEHKGCVS